jgi:acyl-CoA dehydrogenase
VFALDPARRELLAATRTAARERLAPVASAGEPGRVNRPLLRALHEEGLLARLFPEGGVSALDLCVLREALAMECTEAETALALQGLGAYPILQAGRPETVERWVPAVARGEAVAAFALTEPQAGSDAAALALRAEPDGDGFRLTGVKTWISNAPEADVYTVFARIGEEPASRPPEPRSHGVGGHRPGRHRGITGFAVPGGSPGLSGESIPMLSPHPIGELRFDDVPVGPEALLGEPGQGFAVAMRTLDLFRPSVGAFAVGMGQAALELALDHAAGREAFGAPLSRLQAVSHRLAEMATRLDAARLLVYRAGTEGTPETAAMAKLYATEIAQQVIDAAIPVHGAAALRAGHPLEHLYREVRTTRIYEGANEVQREIIARELFRRGPSRPAS